MSAFLFGIFGAAFSLVWLIWMLKRDRTADRGAWAPSVARAEAPGRYWYEVGFVGLLLVFCIGIAGDAALRLWA